MSDLGLAALGRFLQGVQQWLEEVMACVSFIGKKTKSAHSRPAKGQDTD